MLESVRSFLSGKTLFVLVTFLAIPFVFFGSSSFGTVFTNYGSINGESVSQTDVSLAASNLAQRYKAIFGEEFNLESLGEETYSELLRKEIIDQKLLLIASKEADLFVNDQQSKKEIIKVEEFQSDGVFDESLFQTIVRSNGFTPEEYITMIQESLSMDYFIQGIANGFQVNDKKVKNYIQAFETTRDVEFFELNFSKIKEAQQFTDEDILSFYESNPLLFFDEERLSLGFVKLNLESFKSDILFDESSIKLAYEEYLAEKNNNIQRKASHIMFDLQNFESLDIAISELSKILADIKSGVFSFEDAVANFSQDEATLESMGDLGFSAGFAFPEEFEVALTSMEPGDISGVINLGDTLHLLKLTEVVKPEILSFEEASKSLRDELLAEEASTSLEEAITNYEQRILAGESFQALFGSEDVSSVAQNSYEDLRVRLGDEVASAAFENTSNFGSVLMVEEDDSVTFFSITERIEPIKLAFEDAKSKAIDEFINLKATQEIERLATSIIDSEFAGTDQEIQTYKEVTRYSSLLPKSVIGKLFSGDIGSIQRAELPDGSLYIIKAVDENLPSQSAIAEKQEAYMLSVSQLEQGRVNQYLDKILREDLNINLKNL